MSKFKHRNQWAAVAFKTLAQTRSHHLPPRVLCRSIVEDAMQCKKKILQNDGVVTSPCARPRKAGHTLLILGGQTFMCDKIYQVNAGLSYLCGLFSCNAAFCMFAVLRENGKNKSYFWDAALVLLCYLLTNLKMKNEMERTGIYRAVFLSIHKILWPISTFFFFKCPLHLSASACWEFVISSMKKYLHVLIKILNIDFKQLWLVNMSSWNWAKQC